MVFLKHVRIYLDSRLTSACSLIVLTSILTVGCSGRGEKKVAITCPPGQSQGADGKCASTAGNQGGGTGTGTGSDTDLGAAIGGEPEFEPETTGATPEENPNETPTPEITPGPTDTPITPQTQTPPASTPQPQPQPQPGPSTGPSSKPPVGTPSATPTPIPANDPINQAESVTTLFKDAPQTTAEGAPTLAFKLINSPSQGKVARVAFSHTNGVTNTEYKYHKKALATTPAASAAAATDGSHAIDLSTIPVSVTFEWNNKKCDSGLVEVDFEAKTTIATCK